MNINVNIPDPLAVRYRAAWEEIDGGREQWIEGTLKLTVVVKEAHIKYPSPTTYGSWLVRNDLRQISKTDLSALNKFAENLAYTRQLLETTKSLCWQQVWRTRPDKPAKKALPESRKGLISTPRGKKGNASGSNKRKRAAEIPWHMRDDYVPGEFSAAAKANPQPQQPKSRRRRNPPTPQPERPAVILKGLTREQVDPDFKGTPAEFAEKYGQVLLQTKQEIEYGKRQEELATWLGLVSELDKTARALMATKVDDATLQEWMSKPAKMQKLRGWYSNIQVAYDAIRITIESTAGPIPLVAAKSEP